MKLYFSPGACSLSPHIVANEVGLPVTLVKVDLQKKTTADGQDFVQINPKGYVPALELDDGRLLTEGPAIVQYLADLKPEKNLAERCGTFERAKVQEWLNYITTELHKNFGGLFNPQAQEEEKKATVEKLLKRISFVEESLKTTDYIAGNHFTVADAYLFTVLSWCKPVGIDLSSYPAVGAYMAKLAERDSIKQALANEKSSH